MLVRAEEVHQNKYGFILSGGSCRPQSDRLAPACVLIAPHSPSSRLNWCPSLQPELGPSLSLGEGIRRACACVADAYVASLARTGGWASAMGPMADHGALIDAPVGEHLSVDPDPWTGSFVLSPLRVGA